MNIRRHKHEPYKNDSTANSMKPYCEFCQTNFTFEKLITKALYVKYAASQNYYYQKDINDIILNNRCHAVVQYIEWKKSQPGEYLEKLYHAFEIRSKIEMLSEYYKFHVEVPRQFMIPGSKSIAKYHNKKRRLTYKRITKILGQQQPDEEDTSKHSIGQSLSNLLAIITPSRRHTQDESNAFQQLEQHLQSIVNQKVCDSQYFENKEENLYNLPQVSRFHFPDGILNHDKYNKKMILCTKRQQINIIGTQLNTDKFFRKNMQTRSSTQRLHKEHLPKQQLISPLIELQQSNKLLQLIRNPKIISQSKRCSSIDSMKKIPQVRRSKSPIVFTARPSYNLDKQKGLLLINRKERVLSCNNIQQIIKKDRNTQKSQTYRDK